METKNNVVLAVLFQVLQKPQKDPKKPCAPRTSGAQAAVTPGLKVQDRARPGLARDLAGRRRTIAAHPAAAPGLGPLGPKTREGRNAGERLGGSKSR